MKKTSEEIKQGYRKRLILPEFCKEEMSFFTKSKTKVATNYIRVVIGDRGPYIEFSEDMIVSGPNIIMPKSQTWRVKNGDCYYIEYRTDDCSNVKIYKQKRPVYYADYKIGLWYISPFDLTSNIYTTLIKELT